MKIEARIVKKYRFQDNYSFVLMASENEEAVLFYLKKNNRDELLLSERCQGMSMDDTDEHLKEITRIGEKAVVRYETVYAELIKSNRSEEKNSGEEKAADPAPLPSTYVPLTPMKSSFKKLGSVEREEKARLLSQALTQKNSTIDYRFNRKGELVKQVLSGNQDAILSDLKSIIELINHRLNDDIRPLLDTAISHRDCPELLKGQKEARDVETTIRYVVNSEGRMSACSVIGTKYPLCRTILEILKSLSENAPEGIDEFTRMIKEQLL